MVDIKENYKFDLGVKGLNIPNTSVFLILRSSRDTTHRHFLRIVLNQSQIVNGGHLHLKQKAISNK